MDIIMNSTIKIHLKQHIGDEDCGGLIEELWSFENSQISRERKPKILTYFRRTNLLLRLLLILYCFLN